MILVTGASGFIGRSLTRALEQQERPFWCYDGRINDPIRLRQSLAGVHVVFHLAGAESRGRAPLLQQVDVKGTEQLLEQCRRADVKRVIVMSRIGADANSLYPLLRAKGQVERLVRRSGLSYTIVRSASLFGMDDRFLNVIASLAAWSWPLLWLPGKGESLLQPLWVEDLVRCLLCTLERSDLEKETITLAGDERLHYRKLAELVLETTSLGRLTVRVDMRLIRAVAALSFGWWPQPPVSRFFLDRLSVPDIAPVDSVLRTFGFRPIRLVNHMAYLRRPGVRRRLFYRGPS